MPISTQAEQYQAFAGDAGVYARRDPVTAVYDVDDFGPDLLAGPTIHAGLNDPRAFHAGDFDAQYDHSRPSMSDLYAHEPRHLTHEEFDEEFPHGEPPPGGPEPGVPLMPLHQMLEHSYRPDPPEPPSFSEARRRTADGGPELEPFNPNLYSPADRLRWESQAAGADNKWVTAQTVLPAQPQAPGQPVWLGHTFAPGHRVGLPWRDRDIPGTVTHLDGTDVGVRWDDGQHSVEQAGDIRPLYQ